MTEFEIRWMEDFARKFADVYEAHGEETAGAFAYSELREHQYGVVQPFVQQELEKRGYTLEIFEAD